MKQPISNLDPKLILRHAMSFHHSARKLLHAQDEDPEKWAFLAQPYMALLAFASELYLKCIHTIDSGVTPPGHDLKRLFDALPSLRQRWILGCWDQLHRRPEYLKMWADMEGATGEHMPRDLPSILTACARGFEDMRYIYENPKGPKFYGLDDFPDVVRSAILQIHPDWKNISYAINSAGSAS